VSCVHEETGDDAVKVVLVLGSSINFNKVASSHGKWDILWNFSRIRI
jgi:hypothetical protein